MTFRGIRDGVEYPVHKIVECHCLPGDGRNKPIIVKFLYNHQRDEVWEQRNSFF